MILAFAVIAWLASRSWKITAGVVITLLLIGKGVDKETAIAAAIISRGVPQWTGLLTGLACLGMLGTATTELPPETPAEAPPAGAT